MIREIPLLSEKPLREWTPFEYREYVKSLYYKPPPKGKKEAKPFCFRLNAKGTLVLTSAVRKPKFLTEGEMQHVSRETKKPLNEVFLKMKEKGWKLMTEEEYKRIRAKGEKC